MTPIDTLEQALAALEEIGRFKAGWLTDCKTAATNLRTLIEQMKKAEPVGLFILGDQGWYETECGNGQPLYAAPQLENKP